MTLKGALIFIGVTMVSAAALGQGSWERIPVPTENWLRSVVFTDSLTGWAAGNGGIIIHTEDGGQDWTVQESGTTNDIVDVFFLNQNLGWASSFNFIAPPYGTVLLKTVDGGAEWTQVDYPQENIFINCILMLDSLHGWMGGSPHALVHTSDGGETWAQAQVDTATLAFFPVLGIQFWDDQYGYACGGMFDIAGVIWRTWDGGGHWYALDPAQAPADEVHGLYLYDSLTVMGAGGDPDFGYGVGLMRTWDGGLNWDYSELGIQGTAYDLDFRGENEVWAPLGPRRKMIYSIDGGNHWTQITSPDSTAIFDICFPDTLHGWAVGAEGAMLKYTPPEPVGIPEYPIAGKETNLLRQNYPNPFTSITTIRFTIPSSPGLLVSMSSRLLVSLSFHIHLTLYNLLGEEVKTLLDADLTPGEQSISVDGSGLPPGIYLCRLQVRTDDGILTESIILNKGD